MTPVSIDVPHKLGRVAARERIKAKIGRLPDHLPGNVGAIHSSWPSEDELALDIQAMRQSVPVRLEVEDDVVRVHLSLPPMLAFFSGAISAAVRDQGARVLEDKRG